MAVLMSDEISQPAQRVISLSLLACNGWFEFLVIIQSGSEQFSRIWCCTQIHHSELIKDFNSQPESWQKVEKL